MKTEDISPTANIMEVNARMIFLTVLLAFIYFTILSFSF